VAYNADIATATSMAPQLGTLSSTTTPTSTQAAVIWAKAYNQVRVALLTNGISDSITASSVAEAWAQQVEMLLTSGYVLLAKETIGPQRSAPNWHASQQLIAKGQALLDSLPTVRMMLLDNGGSADAGSADSRAGSHWTRAKDPDWDPAPGTGDAPYAATPIWPDGSDL
tara:strand:+ start:1033 stop:1539 length:507 start_codon:yes stop_codon:yes gene_type:complete